MELIRTERFAREYEVLPAQVRKRVDRKLAYLLESIAHPSLRVKRVRRREGIFEGSISMSYRFLFAIAGDTYVLLRIGKHDILDKL